MVVALARWTEILKIHFEIALLDVTVKWMLMLCGRIKSTIKTFRWKLIFVLRT